MKLRNFTYIAIDRDEQQIKTIDAVFDLVFDLIKKSAQKPKIMLRSVQQEIKN